MVHMNEVDRQLKALGVDIKFWGRSEVMELQHVLMPGEKITGCLNGRYEGGFALLCTTDQRILLIDKKPMYLSIEDIRYDMVAVVDFHARLLDSTINICTPSKNVTFTGFKQKPLRAMASYIQNRVMEFRQMHMMDAMQPQQVQEDQRQLRQQQAQAQVQQQQPAPTPILDDVQLQYQTYQTTPVDDPADEQKKAMLRQVVRPIQFGAANPYTKVPLMMRRRVGRFYGS